MKKPWRKVAVQGDLFLGKKQKKCSACKGVGRYTYTNFRMNIVTVTCPICRGTGYKD